MNTRKYLEKLAGGPLTFGDLIASIRKGEDLSQVDFASDYLGISKSQLCDIEKGRKSVSAAKAAEYAEALGYSPELFVKLALQDELKRAGLRLKVEIKAS